MITKSKKTLLWYSIFALALRLNQSGAMKNDIKVLITSYGLWILLIILTWIYFKESKWD